MRSQISRRRMIASGAGALGSFLFVGCKDLLPPTYGSLLGLGDALTFATHRMLLPGHSLAREFSRDKISAFPPNGTTNPADETYQRLLKGNFADWRLPVDGLVMRPSSLSLADLKQFPSRTQVTQHNCEEGWSAIGEWTGVQLGRVLAAVGTMPAARYVVLHCVDGWWDSLDMLDALHPQTLLAYGMNGADLPVAHGAPLRLRVERQLGYKSLKFVKQITVTDRVDNIEDGNGAGGVKYGYCWYSGI